MDNFNPDKCPVGIKHEEQIESTRKVFEMAIQRLEEKIDDIKDDVNSGFKKVDNRFNDLEERFNNFESSLPERVDERINEHDSKKAAGITKWLFITLGGSVLITVVTRLLLTHFGL